MNKILIALLTLLSLSSHAESYRCSSPEGEIFLDIKEIKIIMDLSQYRNGNYDYDYIGALNKESNIELAIQEVKNPYGIIEKVNNREKFLTVYLGTPADWEYWTLKMKLNKKTQKLTIKSFSSFIFRSKDHKDKLDCVQL